MTVPGPNVEQTGAEDYPEIAKSTPVPVHVVGSERQRIARYRSTFTVTTINNADLVPVQRLLAQAGKRHRAIVSSRPLLTGEQMEYVVIGSEEQVMNAQGYRLWNGENRVIESSSALFLGPGTNPPTHPIAISVIDERFE